MVAPFATVSLRILEILLDSLLTLSLTQISVVVFFIVVPYCFDIVFAWEGFFDS